MIGRKTGRESNGLSFFHNIQTVVPHANKPEGNHPLPANPGKFSDKIEEDPRCIPEKHGVWMSSTLRVMGRGHLLVEIGATRS